MAIAFSILKIDHIEVIQGILATQVIPDIQAILDMQGTIPYPLVHEML
ncbi:hypothetical protein [Moorella sp. E308F]|nr:hypothetical protein [Moorella sp. E308F]